MCKSKLFLFCLKVPTLLDFLRVVPTSSLNFRIARVLFDFSDFPLLGWKINFKNVKQFWF